MPNGTTPTPPKKKPLRSYSYAAERLGNSVSSVRRIVARRELIAIDVGGVKRIEDEELEDYIRRQRARALRARLDKDE
jgi:excisionase family DNA binding protein